MDPRTYHFDPSERRLKESAALPPVPVEIVLLGVLVEETPEIVPRIHALSEVFLVIVLAVVEPDPERSSNRYPELKETGGSVIEAPAGTTSTLPESAVLSEYDGEVIEESGVEVLEGENVPVILRLENVLGTNLD